MSPGFSTYVHTRLPRCTFRDATVSGYTGDSTSRSCYHMCCLHRRISSPGKTAHRKDIREPLMLPGWLNNSSYMQLHLPHLPFSHPNFPVGGSSTSHAENIRHRLWKVKAQVYSRTYLERPPHWRQ